MSLFKKLARSTGLYDWVRYSPFYEPIQRLRNPEHFKSVREEVDFYKALFSGRQLDLIFDVGANLGGKAEVFVHLAKKVVCFEPDPRLAEHLKKRFKRVPNITIEACGLSDREGEAKLHTYDGGSAYNTFSSVQHTLICDNHGNHQVFSVPISTLDFMIKKHGKPDFLKVDVEGHEKEVFSGLSSGIEFISYEANLPEFAEETCQIAHSLAKLSNNIRFGVGGSGVYMTNEFPYSASELTQIIKAPDAPNFYEVFVKSVFD